MKKVKSLLVSIIIATLVMSGATISVAASNYSGHWAQSSIERAVDMGWLSDANNFSPDSGITRSEFVSMINKMEGYTLESYSSLNPDATITRNEAVMMIARLAGLDTEDSEWALAYVGDAAEIPESARPYAGAAIANGLIAGINGNFCGDRNLSKAEAVVLLERLFDGVRLFALAGDYKSDLLGGAFTIAPNTVFTLAQNSLGGTDYTVSKGEVTLKEGQQSVFIISREDRLTIESGAMLTVDKGQILRYAGLITIRGVLKSADTSIAQVEVDLDYAKRLASEDMAEFAAWLNEGVGVTYIGENAKALLDEFEIIGSNGALVSLSKNSVFSSAVYWNEITDNFSVEESMGLNHTIGKIGNTDNAVTFLIGSVYDENTKITIDDGAELILNGAGDAIVEILGQLEVKDGGKITVKNSNTLDLSDADEVVLWDEEAITVESGKLVK